MAVDFDAFLTWAENKFGEAKVKGKEIMLNSPWSDDDTGHHLWCSPSGGKKRRDHGVYRCFKTEKRGTLTGLVMEFDHCTFDEALDILEGGCSLREMEKRLEEMLATKEEKKAEPPPPGDLSLPDRSFLITSMPEESIQRMSAVSYLTGRQIPIDGFYYCTAGRYQDRIVIPYYDRTGKLIYFNTRYIGHDKKALRYLGPPKETGIGKGDVLYAYDWAPLGSRVYLTEGEFDARTLNLCGLYGVACGGRYCTEKQIEMLRGYKVCMAFDADKAGEQAQMGDRHVDDWKNLKWLPKDTTQVHRCNGLLNKGMEKDMTFVRPPKVFKDWNAMMCEVGTDLVREYIQKCEKPLDAELALQRLCRKQVY